MCTIPGSKKSVSMIRCKNSVSEGVAGTVIAKSGGQLSPTSTPFLTKNVAPFDNEVEALPGPP